MFILTSMLQNDFYKFPMAQVVLHQCQGAWVKYKFKCRTGTGLPTTDPKGIEKFMQALNAEIDHLCNLQFTKEELHYLSENYRFLSKDFIDYLSLVKLNREHIKCYVDADCKLSIEIEGPWIRTIWFECMVLAIVSQLYHSYQMENEYNANVLIEGRSRLKKNIALINEYRATEEGKTFVAADFAFRRAWSVEWHETGLRELIENTKGFLIGTSNVYLAMKYGIKAIGTQAHELFMGFQQLGRLVDSQAACLEAWAKEFRGSLGIALSDTVGFDAFLKDFDLYFAKLFDGTRNDSGDPYEWAEKQIAHYEKLGLDPRTKTAVFSNMSRETAIPDAINIHKTFHDRISCPFGIGGGFMNNLGTNPPSIVIKMVECNGKPVAKLSDDPGKTMCEDPGYIDYLKQVFEVV